MKYTKSDLKELQAHLKQAWDDGVIDFEAFD